MWACSPHVSPALTNPRLSSDDWRSREPFAVFAHSARHPDRCCLRLNPPPETSPSARAAESTSLRSPECPTIRPLALPNCDRPVPSFVGPDPLFPRTELLTKRFLAGFWGQGGDLREAFAITLLPILPIGLGFLEHLLIVGFDLRTMRGNIVDHIGDLLVVQIEPIANELGRPVGGDVVHHIIERDAGTGNGQPTLGANHSWSCSRYRSHSYHLSARR